MITILSTLATRIVTQENREKLAELKIADIGDDVLNGFLATADVNLAWGNTYLASVESYLVEADTTVDPTASTTPTTPTAPTGPTVPTTPTAAPTPSPDSYRLPSSISPSAYILHLAITGFDSFNGSVTVDFLALDEDVKSVVMHASDLTIGKVRVFEKYTNKDVVVEGVKSSPEVEQISINLAQALQPGITTYSVAIDYTGPVRSDFTGLYHTTIGDGDLIGTQMYPAYARRVLPCFDEPHFRTPFKLNVLHEQNLVAVSSSANLEARRALRRGLRTAIVEDDYEVTTNIPLAQVGLFLVDYREYNKVATDGMTLVGRKELVEAAKSSGVLAQAQTLMWWFGNASGVAAAPAHLNLLGLSSSLDDAVSTWGLVAMRERNMADMDTSPSSGDSEQNWLTQLARTLSQIWFGGMVSPDWWSSAWLSEGFATFFQYSVPATLQPTWQLPYQMYTRAIAPALHADSFEGAHPLNADVSGSQETIADALDVIASGKGGAVVQMLSHVLEDNNAFDAGLKAFFKDGEKLPHTTVPDELYAAMDKAAKQVNADTKLPAGATLKEAIGTWVDGSGYPVVNVIRDYNAKKATISQERFLLHSPSSSQQSLSGSWWVPLSYALRAEYMSIDYTPKVPLKTWLAPGQDLTIDLADNSDWLLVNADRREFFRVNYDIRNWKMLGDYMLEYHQLVETVARAMLVDDALALSRSGRLDYPVALKFLDYLRLDVDLAPWEAARRGFDYLDAQLLGSRHEAVYKTWLLQLLDAAVEEAGFVPEDRDSHTQRLTRAVVTAWACDLGQESCTRYAKRDFDTWITEPNGVSHDTLAAVVCVGLRNGDADTLKTVTARLAAEEDDAQRAAIIQGLGCGGNVHALFDLTVRPGLRRGEPALLWGSATRFRPADVTQSMHCFTNMHKRVAAQYGRASIVDIARVLANRVTTQTQLDLLTALVSDIDASLLQGALLLAKDNVAWREDNLDAVADVLYELTNTPDPDLPTSPTTSTTTTTTMTIPTGPVPTDPATVTASTGTTSTWTLPPSVSTSTATLPTLDPVTVPPGTGPTDPATGSTASTGTYFTLPPTSPTTPVTLPPVPTGGPSSTSPATTATPGPPPTPVVPTKKPNSSSGLATNTALLLAGIVAIILH
ncbi:aminopeptidase N [Frankliniella occidentalis]|uniref:Aminopeptidase N n=1 Tax=Frankliniella occidentalis TaxID=133901 RepID=A0A9C6X4H6_FRAOC|nr:aminopeptidase N [Frankliniella occidentalis]